MDESSDDGRSRPKLLETNTPKEKAPMRRIVISIAVAGLAAVVALLALAAVEAVTWHSGPTFTNNGDGTFTATGDGSGFGNQPAVATIALNGTVRYTCQNQG